MFLAFGSFYRHWRRLSGELKNMAQGAELLSLAPHPHPTGTIRTLSCAGRALDGIRPLPAARQRPLAKDEHCEPHYSGATSSLTNIDTGINTRPKGADKSITHSFSKACWRSG